MKTGDRKQAIGLGVVAFFAIAFLGHTLFSTVGGGSKPPVMTTTSRSAGQSSGQPAGEGQRANNSPNPPVDGPSANSDDSATETAPEVIPEPSLTRDPYSHVQLQLKDKKKRGGDSPSSGGGNSMLPPMMTGDLVPDGSTPGLPNAGLPNTGLPIPEKGGLKSVPDENTGKSRSNEEDEPKAHRQTLRFEGCVDAGSPMAILLIGERRINASPGDWVGKGLRVTAVTSEKLTFSLNGKSLSVRLGKEIEL